MISLTRFVTSIGDVIPGSLFLLNRFANRRTGPVSTLPKMSQSSQFRSKNLRVGLVGTGYIAEFHARAIRAAANVDLVAVCDSNLLAAQAFAKAWTIPDVFQSLEMMLQNARLDCVHLLVPPDLHHSLAKIALNAGVHVFIEKPMCTSVSEADELLALSVERNLYLGVSHNFMFTSAYARLRAVIERGDLGPIDEITLNYLFELPQIRLGPFDSWMLRSPGNVILETGPHLLSILLDLGGKPDSLNVIVDREISLPNGSTVFRRWRMRAATKRIAMNLTLNMGPGFPHRTVFVRGLFGTATADLDANTCIIDRRTPLDMDLDRYSRAAHFARQLRVQSLRTLLDCLLGKFKVRGRGNPFQKSITDSVSSFYNSICAEDRLDIRIDAQRGREIISFCSDVVEAAALPITAPPQPASPVTLAAPPSVLVVGAAGFIGRELVRKLLASGYCVRAMVRGTSSVLQDLACDRLEIVRGDIRQRDDLLSALSGISFVYHLAHAQAKTWDEYLNKDVEPARYVGEACLAAGVKRLVYTGTIASYFTGTGSGTITDTCPLDPAIAKRDYYSRAKAASEAILLQMQRESRLPLVIARPGIVIGRGGNPFHWGVGRFSENICEVWGDGAHRLPFVLVQDVADALARMIEVPDIEGNAYNLCDVPLLSARDYLSELQRLSSLRLDVRYRPMWQFYAADLAKWVVKVLVKHPDRIRVPNYRDWDARRHLAVFDCSRACADLGWRPVGARDAMIKFGIDEALSSWRSAVE
ncbi:NAD-dependent epimerase/dehydratase family protein [Bradyrhizobium sp. Tv2a-2]|uniref:NAD-dependent epimerase/dehydratase family protein n=1 Tax=Bradyrhizobium sp. Tv2a-2 TaxID=113395 RepID=UPI0004005570|nr:NAD-dependent epimerase/dehydratase family protein [Bradyrhizobium sp. Tv2a-2]